MVRLLLALAEGLTGYDMPDDLLSGVGLRMAYSIVLAIAVIGTWVACPRQAPTTSAPKSGWARSVRP